MAMKAKSVLTNIYVVVGYTTSIKDPVIAPLSGHVGAVTSLAFSPYHDDIFASVGTDLQIRIYSLKQVCC